jgi:hypothetical protein
MNCLLCHFLSTKIKNHLEMNKNINNKHTNEVVLKSYISAIQERNRQKILYRK